MREKKYFWTGESSALPRRPFSPAARAEGNKKKGGRSAYCAQDFHFPSLPVIEKISLRDCRPALKGRAFLLRSASKRTSPLLRRRRR